MPERIISTHSRASGHREDGSATLELAVAMPAVVLMLALVLAVARVVLVQIDCIDAARAGARAAARGDSPEVVRRAAAHLAPAGAAVSVQSNGGTVEVRVSSRQVVGGPLGGAVLTGARATAAVEAGS